MFTHMRKTTLTLAALTLTFSVFLAGGTQGRQNELLDRRVERLDLQADNIHLALSEFAQAHGVPVGLEMARGGSAGPRVNVSLKDVTVKEVLDAFISQDPQYEWRLVDGVVNVTPRDNRDPFLQDLLDVTVKGFAVSEGATLYDLRVNITNLPEVRQKLIGNNITASSRGSITGADLAKVGKKFTLYDSQLSLRGILNRIIKDGEPKYWVVNRYGEKNDILVINF